MPSPLAFNLSQDQGLSQRVSSEGNDKEGEGPQTHSSTLAWKIPWMEDKLETPALGQCSHPPSLRFWATAALPRWPGKKPPATQLCSCSSSLSSCLSATRLATPSCFPICLVFIHQLPVPHSVQPLPAGSFPPTFKPKCIFSFQKTSSLNSTVTFCPVPNLLKGWSSLAFLSQLPLMPGKFGLGVQNYAGQRLTEFGQENAHWS